MASFGFGSGCLHSLVRRKPVDSSYNEPLGDRLARNLTAFHLVAIGVGSTIGAGVYVLVGTVARERAGIALILSFLIAGIGAALSAFCYAELASRCPSAGSAYHYSYICVGEGIAWLVGWALILEYTVCAAAIARGFSPNLVIFFGGKDNLPAFLIRQNVPGTDIVVDPCGAILCIIIAGILCLGIKESALTQTIVTTTNVCVMLFVIVAGSIIGFQTGWPGYKLHGRYLPHGINGVLSGASIVFFSYIGFDAVAGTAEEVKDPQRNLPLGIGISLSLCSGLYMLVAAVVVGIVPYYAMDPDTPISSAFLEHGMPWAMYIVTSGAVAALLSTLLGSILPQPRILLSMARDGLLPSFFSDINENASVPVKSTLLTGFVAAIMAFCMEFSQLANMVNVGTLIALTVVAVSVLILRYVPPAKVPLLAPLHQSANYGSSSHSPQRSSGGLSQASPITFTHNTSSDPREADDASMSKNGSIFQEFQPSEENENLLKSTESIEVPLRNPLILKDNHHDGKLKEQKRRRLAALSISFLCAGVLLVTFATSIELPLRWITWCMGAIGIFLLLWGLIVLSFIEQDEGRHSFGHAGGFTCPCVPALPAACILVNVYLMINLGARTWLQVSIWLLIGIAIYLFYGIKHSLLSKAMYAPIPQANKVVQSPMSALVLV